MIDILIDAPLLACPGEDVEGDNFNDAFLNFISSLTELSKFRKSLSSAQVWRESSLASTLYEINAYPFKHAIENAINKVDSSFDFQLEDISLLANSLLLKSNCLNEFVDIEDVALENCFISDDPIGTRNDVLIKYLFRTVEFAFVHLGKSKGIPNSVKLTNQPMSDDAPSPVLQYQLSMASYRDGSVVCPNINRSIKLENFCGNILTLQGIDVISLWKKNDMSSLVDAISIFAANQKDISFDSLNAFKSNIKIGQSFLESCRPLGFINDNSKIRRLISACVDICINRNLNQSHWLRRGAGANESQKTRRDGACAWRHDVDQEFHLHYWKRGEIIEFSNVVVHNDFSIFN